VTVAPQIVQLGIDHSFDPAFIRVSPPSDNR